MRKVAFHTLGCKVNAYETEAMQQLMVNAGYNVVDFNQKADIYIVNTCSVTNMADRKSRQMLHKAKRENPDAVVVAAGCYAQASAEKIRDDENIDIIVGNNLKKDIVRIIGDYFSDKNVYSETIPAYMINTKEKKKDYIIDINKTKEFENLNISQSDEHTRAFIKIQDGCNQFCTYCIIPFTRGRVRSRKAEDILEEIKKMTLNGYKEIVLTGIHLSSYGVDLKDEEINSLLKITKAISEVENVERIRLSSLEPRIITEEFLQGLKKIPQFCPHFHLSLQSGCDETLKRMNRRYDLEQYREGVRLIREYFDNPAITTDVIVGFPGETKEEFLQTYDFLKEIGFYEMHIFPYSLREGTKASLMKDTLTRKDKSKRAGILAVLEENMSYNFRKLNIGRSVEVIIEDKIEINNKEYMSGYTKEYIRVAIEDTNLKRRSVVKGIIKDFLTKDILLLENF
jgi:MiaB-like protein